MIFENGIVRTMEPSLPTARGRAVAGEWIAGGGGTHETALPSPERLDHGGAGTAPAVAGRLQGSEGVLGPDSVGGGRHLSRS